MPVIFNVDPNTVDTPLRDLLQYVAGALEKAAPERAPEFEKLYARLAKATESPQSRR